MKARWKDPAFVKMRKANASETARRLAKTLEHREKFAAASRKYWSNPENVATRTAHIAALRETEPGRFVNQPRALLIYNVSEKGRRKSSETLKGLRATQSPERRREIALLGAAKRAENKLAREQYLASLPTEEADRLREEARAKKSAETKAGRARATPEQKEASRERYRQAALRRHAAKKASAT